MKIRLLIFLFIAMTTSMISCKEHTISAAFDKDLEFLQKHDDKLIVLSNGDAKVIVSAKYQAKVFTSTTGDGASFGWINHKAFDTTDAHMNAYGGENRLWLGPEGGKFSLFFPKDDSMEFKSWKTPAAFDSEPWGLVSASDTVAILKKDMQLVNYTGTQFSLSVDRKIKILDASGLEAWLGIGYDKAKINYVGYFTENTITNKGSFEWNDTTGMPCIWMLDMFPPSDSTTIIIPYKRDSINKPATTDYFGEIPADRLKYDYSINAGGILFFKADGKQRGKLGIHPTAAKNTAGSYDAANKILTVVLFDISPMSKYLNQEWNTTKDPFSGDAVNAYNDGPLAGGGQLGPFYELESVSSAAFLPAGHSLTHRHSVFHFTGDEPSLNAIALKTLGVSLEQIKHAFGH